MAAEFSGPWGKLRNFQPPPYPTHPCPKLCRAVDYDHFCLRSGVQIWNTKAYWKTSFLGVSHDLLQEKVEQEFLLVEQPGWCYHSKARNNFSHHPCSLLISPYATNLPLVKRRYFDFVAVLCSRKKASWRIKLFVLLTVLRSSRRLPLCFHQADASGTLVYGSHTFKKTSFVHWEGGH